MPRRCTPLPCRLTPLPGPTHARDSAVLAAEMRPAGLLTILTGVTVEEVHAAHKADLSAWAREQQLRDHPDLAVLDADLDLIRDRA